ncbi:hypothetical protein N0V88_004751 [Collariella sp. IMI 366227]|nr:hypothetical protein N0V88_004751 [Collariella sp. IMI 366227]
MSREVDPLISCFTHFKHFPHQDEALHLLKKIASLVKPLMRARSWRVGELGEMYPDQANLLGLNFDKGRRILIRLRHPQDSTQFLPFEKIVDTMLHELSHNVHGPHDDKFNALWEQLREELEGLMNKGYTGEGFLSRGDRLGGRDIPPHEARRLARAAAERRRVLTAGSGQRLGGFAPQPGQDLRRVMLDSIERRRSTTEQGCANSSRTNREIEAISQSWTKNGFRTQAEEDKANEAAIAQALWELVQEDQRKYDIPYRSPFDSDPFGYGGGSFPQGGYGGRGADFARNAARPMCTLRNPAYATSCEACETQRPAAVSRAGNREVIDLTKILSITPEDIADYEERAADRARALELEARQQAAEAQARARREALSRRSHAAASTPTAGGRGGSIHNGGGGLDFGARNRRMLSPAEHRFSDYDDDDDDDEEAETSYYARAQAQAARVVSFGALSSPGAGRAIPRPVEQQESEEEEEDDDDDMDIDTTTTIPTPTNPNSIPNSNTTPPA